MPAYNRLQPLSFDLKPLDGHPLTRFQIYEFPARWAEALRARVFPSPDPDEPRGIPLWAVNAAIAMLIPHVLTHDGTARAGRTWLAWSHGDHSPEPDHDLLVELVRGGLIAAANARNAKAARQHWRPSVDLTALAEVLEDFRPDDLRHTTKTVRIAPGEPVDPEDYLLLAQAIATHLVASEWKVEHGDLDIAEEQDPVIHGVSTWRRTAFRDPGAELVSFPPHKYRANKGKGALYPWSYTLRLAVQNIPLDGSLVLHANVGMRRWARSPVYDGSRAIGAHLLTPSPWADATCPIGLASMKWQPGPAGAKEGKMVWHDDLVPVLARLTDTSFLPAPADLARDPLGHLYPQDPAQAPLAAVPFRHGLGKKCRHSVGDGVSAKDRARILTQLEPAVAEFATLSEPYKAVPVKTPKRPTADDVARIRPQDLAAAAGPDIELTLWYDTDVMRDELIGAVTAAFDIDRPIDDIRQNADTVFELPELTLTLRLRQVGDMATALALDPSITDYRDRIAQAASLRRELVRDRMRQPQGRPGTARFAVIEMAGNDAFGRDQDPKQPVKSAAADENVLTQNVRPPLEPGDGKNGTETAATLKERARKAVGDLLVRQNGLLRRPSVLGTRDTPLNEVTPLGLWVVRRNGDARAALPLAVAWLPDQPFAVMRLPHIDTWLPFRQGMLRLAGWNTGRVFKDNQVQDFFAEVVGEAADGSDVALFTHTQNIRSSCPGIANGHLRADTLAFDPDNPLDLDSLKGIRHLRLRTNLRQETSQHYAYNENDPLRRIGLSTNLWTHPRYPRLFFSTTGKPRAAGPGSPAGSRIEPHWVEIKPKDNDEIASPDEHDGEEEVPPQLEERHDTLKDVWNPQLLEILLALQQEGDNPAAWAAYAHQQRHTAGHFPDPLVLPGVLHLAHKVSEYLLPPHEREPLLDPEG